MSSIESRAVSAVKRLAVARREVQRLTKAIGHALAKCEGVNGGLVFVAVPGQPIGKKDPNDITHLRLAYTPELSESQYRRREYMDEDELHDYLKESCPHCLLAHLLVQERRKARKALGRANAVVTILGRAMLEGDE